MSKPRILLVMNDFSRTGAPIVALRMFRRLKDDLDVRVVALSGGPLEESFREVFPVTVLRPPVPGRRLVGRGRAMAYQALSTAWRPDIVYVNTVAALPTWYRMWAARRRGAPVLLHVHEGPVYLAEIESTYPGIIAHEPHRYVLDAVWIGEHLQAQFGISPDAMTVVRPPVGDEFLSEPMRTGMTNADGPIVIGGAGAPSWMKGTELWLLTAAELRRRDPSGERFRFRWVGDRGDETSRQMKSMIHKLQLDGVMEFLPHTADHKDLYHAMDVFLMSSWEDPSPVVVLEAMALGKPVACFRGSGGPPEEVADTGVVVEDFSPAEMADAIESLAGAPERRASLGAAARERARQHFALDVITPQIAQVIASSLRRPA